MSPLTLKRNSVDASLQRGIDSESQSSQPKMKETHRYPETADSEVRSGNNREIRRSGDERPRYFLSDGSRPEAACLSVEDVLAAYPSTRDWRTAWGIGKDLGYSEEAVAEVLESNSDVFEVSPITPGGIPLYRPRRPS